MRTLALALVAVAIAAAIVHLFPGWAPCPMPGLAILGPAAIGGLTETSKMPGLSFSLPARKTCPVGNRLAEIPGTSCFNCFAYMRGAYAWAPVIMAQARRHALVLAAMVTAAGRKAWASALALYLNKRTEHAKKRMSKAGAPTKQDIAAFYTLQAAGARCSAGAKRIAKGGNPAKEKNACQHLASTWQEANAAWEALKKNHPSRVKAVRAWVAYENTTHFRWHDSGDVFDPRYFEMLVAVADQTPEVKHWLPTQERATVNNWLAKHATLPANLAIRFSSPKKDVHPVPKVAGLAASSVSTDGTTPGALCLSFERGGTCGPCRLCWNVNVPLVTYKEH